MPGYDDEPLPSLGDMFAAGVMRPTPGPPADVAGIIQPFFPSGFMPPTLPKIIRKPYRHDWRGQRPGEYNPNYYDIEEDLMRGDAGNVVARRDKLKPKPNLVPEIPAKADPELMYRGMSAGELANIFKTGQIQSKGDYNLGEVQRDLTVFGKTPETAEYYAGAFAPKGFKPTFDSPGYVVAAKRPPPGRIVTADHFSPTEINVRGPLSAEEITHVYQGRPARYVPGLDDQYGTMPPSFDLHWELLNALRGLK